MSYYQWMTAKDVLRVNAFKWPDKIGAKDLYKAYTFKEWNERACRLANAMADMGMKKGDTFAALGYNCVEWLRSTPPRPKAASSSCPSCSAYPRSRWSTTSTTPNVS